MSLQLAVWLVPLALFAFGTMVGSFLNVAILRGAVFSGKRTVFQGRSRCAKCDRELHWLELIPIISFVFLRGRCRTCQQEISVQYPLVEFAMGLLVLSLGTPLPTTLSQGLELVLLILITGVLLILFVIDLRTMFLPDMFVIILSALTLILLLVRGIASSLGLQATLLEALWGAALGSGLLWLIWFGTRGKGIGFGDVKIMIPLGALVGVWGTATLLFIAFVTGGVLGAVLLLTKLAKPHSAIPFGPFLIGATLVLLLNPGLVTSFRALLFGG